MPTTASYITLANYAFTGAQNSASYASNVAIYGNDTDMLKALTSANQSNLTANKAMFDAAMNSNLNIESDMESLKTEMSDIKDALADMATITLEAMMSEAEVSALGAGSDSLSSGSINAMFGIGGNN